MTVVTILAEIATTKMDDGFRAGSHQCRSLRKLNTKFGICLEIEDFCKKEKSILHETKHMNRQDLDSYFHLSIRIFLGCLI